MDCIENLTFVLVHWTGWGPEIKFFSYCITDIVYFLPLLYYSNLRCHRPGLQSCFRDFFMPVIEWEALCQLTCLSKPSTVTSCAYNNDFFCDMYVTLSSRNLSKANNSLQIVILKTTRMKVLWNIITLGQKLCIDLSTCNFFHILGLFIYEQNFTDIMVLELWP